MSKRKSHTKLTSFLQKTFELLSETSNADTVAWTADGMGFAIYSVPDFSERILPKYFKHNNFASFVRQLNMYDFHKSREEDCDNVFRHPFFIKGKRSLLKEIHRKTSELHMPLETSGVLSKADCERLLSKVQELQGQHQTLEQTVQVLRGENRDMAIQNRDLLDELNYYKAREEKLESLLRCFSGRLQHVYSAQDLVSRFWQVAHDDAPLGLMEEQTPSEYEAKDVPQTDRSYGNYKGDVGEGSSQYAPEASAAPPGSEDEEMEAEIDKFLSPET